MSLPFLKNRRVQSMIVMHKREGEPMEMQNEDPLIVAADDLQSAMKSGDPMQIASALRAAFQILESEPHQEGEES